MKFFTTTRCQSLSASGLVDCLLRSRTALVSVFCAGLLAAGPAAAAAVDNAGFERTDLAPWVRNGPIFSVTGLLLSDGGQMRPTEGSRFALLQTDGTVQATTLASPAIALSADTTIAFDVFLSTDEDLLGQRAQANDRGFAQLLNLSSGVTTTLFTQDVASLLAGGNDTLPWTELRFDIPEAGIYRLQLGVIDSGDEDGRTFLGVDDVRVTSVPLPAAIGLFLAGFGTLLTRLRRH